MHQINNLKIKCLRSLPEDRRWQIISPHGKVLEEFKYESYAQHFAELTCDFLTSRGRYQDTKGVNE